MSVYARRVVLLWLLISAVIPLVAAKPPQTAATWRAVDVHVDGVIDEWSGGLVPFADQPISVAAMNDGEFLYMAFDASDPGARMQILRRGLIVWFDAEGGTHKRFGLRFPIGAGLPEPGGEPSRSESPRRPGAGEPPDGWSSSDAGRAKQEPPPDVGVANRLEIYGPSKDDARSFTADKAPGIEVHVGQAEGVLSYELRVPLGRNDAHPYAIGSAPGAVVGIGLEMPKLERPEGMDGGRGMGGMGEGGHGGGMGRHGGGGGGGRRYGGGRGGYGQMASMKPLQGWLALKLAAAQ